MPMFTNLPTDVIVNQLHFEAAPEDIEEVGDEIWTNLKTFYTAIYGSANTARANYIDWTLMVVKVFKLSDPTPRIPWISPSFGFTAGTAVTTIPTEVACVLSFHAAPQSGVRYQRLYNRIYLGAIVPSMMTASAVDDFPRFSTAFCTQVGNAARTLLEAGELGGALWRQVSNASGTQIAREVVGGWVDNGPDTQRRRSVLASMRNNWVPIP
uniref:Uncharacterized protein n=1 Tax=uncultured prokaryote TaxID=198431 RepID=A0A0H5QLP6_9ZZZZ|nr:hypothetical protein [uncultured prokaryote]